jgi:hypothetical protein
MELEDEAFFMRSHASTLEARVEVIDPSETAALSCAVEALYRLGAGFLALLPLRACGLQFQDENLDELQPVWGKKTGEEES